MEHLDLAEPIEYLDLGEALVPLSLLTAPSPATTVLVNQTVSPFISIAANNSISMVFLVSFSLSLCLSRREGLISSVQRRA